MFSVQFRESFSLPFLYRYSASKLQIGSVTDFVAY